MDDEYRQYRIDQAHAYLERIRRMGDSCAGLRALVDDARDRASGLKGIDYSAIRVQTSPTDDAMANAVDAIMNAIRGYVVMLAEYEDERFRAAEAVSRTECMPHMGLPISTPRMGSWDVRMLPSVLPPALSEWFTKYWQGTPAKRHTSANTAADSASVRYFWLALILMTGPPPITGWFVGSCFSG